MSYFDKLSMAGNSIVEYINTNSGATKAITILIPHNQTFDLNNTDEELLTNNKACFQALANQTEPMLVFMRYLGEAAPFAQTAVRLRNLHVVGEGVDFFAFSYPMPFTVNGVEVFALSSDKFKLNPDGTIDKIDFNGNVVFVESQLKYMLPGEYGLSADSVPGVFGSTDPRLEFGDSNNVTIYNATGYSGDNITGVFDPKTNTITVAGGWTSNGFGPIENDIVLHITNQNGYLTLVCEDTVQTAAGDLIGLTYTKF